MGRLKICPVEDGGQRRLLQPFSPSLWIKCIDPPPPKRNRAPAKCLNASSKCIEIQKYTYIFFLLFLVFSNEAGDYALPLYVNSLEHSERKIGIKECLITEEYLIVWNQAEKNTLVLSQVRDVAQLTGFLPHTKPGSHPSTA